MFVFVLSLCFFVRVWSFLFFVCSFFIVFIERCVLGIVGRRDSVDSVFVVVEFSGLLGR